MNIFKALGGYMKKQKDCQGNEKTIEFNFSPDDKLVVYAGNPEKKCRTAEQVIDAIVRLLNIVDDLKCVIVCRNKNIAEKVKKANESVGKEIVFAFEEIFPEIISKGKLFIGEGPQIKDAMIEGKPVIFAGDDGYIGIFDESKKEKCIQTDFCCKNETKTDASALAQDIGAFFGLWEDEQEKLGKYAQQVMSEYNK